MGETAFGDREFEWRNMLLANRVIKSGDERTANRKLQNELYATMRELVNALHSAGKTSLRSDYDGEGK